MASSLVPLAGDASFRSMMFPSLYRSNRKGQLGKYHTCCPDKKPQQRVRYEEAASANQYIWNIYLILRLQVKVLAGVM